METWALPFRMRGWLVEPDPADPRRVLLKADGAAPLRIRYDGFFFQVEGDLEGGGTPADLLGAAKGLPYVKLLRTRQGLKVRAEITRPERVGQVLAALPVLQARLEGREAPPTDFRAVDPRQLELLLRPWARAQGGRYRVQEGGGLLQVPGRYPLRVAAEAPGVRLRLDFWAFRADRPSAWEEWLLAIQPHLRFIKATRGGLGCDLPREALDSGEWKLALEGLQAAEERFRQAAEALQEPIVAAVYEQLLGGLRREVIRRWQPWLRRRKSRPA